jgi:hypothetical protein
MNVLLCLSSEMKIRLGLILPHKSQKVAAVDDDMYCAIEERMNHACTTAFTFTDSEAFHHVRNKNFQFLLTKFTSETIVFGYECKKKIEGFNLKPLRDRNSI